MNKWKWQDWSILVILVAVIFLTLLDAVRADELNLPPIENLPLPSVRIPLPDFQVVSETAFVVDITTDEVIYSKNSEVKRSIASITKMMTAYLVVSQQLDYDEVITLTSSDIALSNKGSAKSKLKVGMKFTRERLLNLALMSSENRAAAALGRTTFPGGVPEFVEHMNKTAEVLGMKHTHYVDPIGIGADNTSTAEDLVLLISAASENDVIREFSTTKWKEVELPIKSHRGKLTEYHNTNALVGFQDWDILIQKTGFTDAAGHCVIMVVNIQGHKYAVVELNSPNNQQRAFDAIKLRHWVTDGDELANKDIPALSPYKYARVQITKAKNAIVNFTHKHRHHRKRLNA